MLLEHNYPVYQALEDMLAENNKAILVTATGTGKSYVALEYLERHNLHAMVICPTIRICEDWERRSERVTAITYQRLYRMTEFPDSDCYIFDEAHHVGGKVWGKAAKRLMDTHSEPIIGLTADSKRYLDGGRDVAMEFWDGHVVYGYDQAEAIEKGVLPSATYVCALFGVEERLKELKKNAVSDRLMSKLEMNLRNCGSMDEILRRHMPAGARKGIVFVDNIKSTDSAVEFIRGVYPLEPVTVLHSKLPKRTQLERYEEFDSWDSGYLVAVDMINEGIHLDGVNTVIMLRRTSSPTVFMQQLGRCLMPGNENVAVFDFVGNKSSLKYVEAQTSLFSKPGVSKSSGSKTPFHQERQFIIWDYASSVVKILDDINSYLQGSWSPEEDEIIRKFYPNEGTSCLQYLHGHTQGSLKNRARLLGVASDKRKKEWTPDEDFILRKYYPIEGTLCSARLPGRSVRAIKARARKFRLYMDKLWTPEKENILLQYYPLEGAACCKRINGMTGQQVRSRVARLGIYRTNLNRWTPEEDSVLISRYKKEGCACRNYLPGRTKEQIHARARKLGLASSNRKNSNLWSQQEDDVIRKYYPTEGSACAKRLNNRAKSSVRGRAWKLGVKMAEANT